MCVRKKNSERKSEDKKECVREREQERERENRRERVRVRERERMHAIEIDRKKDRKRNTEGERKREREYHSITHVHRLDFSLFFFSLKNIESILSQKHT